MSITRRELLKSTLLAGGAAALGGAVRLDAAEPAPGGLLRFGVMGDGGSGSDAQLQVAARMLESHRNAPWEFALTLGDNVYENGEPEFFDSKFVDVYRPLLDDGVRIHASLGNHDVRTRGGRDQIAEEAFGFVDGKDEYEFAAGPETADGKQLARFICLNSTRWVEAVDEGDKRELVQLRGALRERLREVDKYRWNVVYMHHPVHAFVKKTFGFSRGHGSSRELQAALEPILVEHGVDLALAGHEHFYQKIRPQQGVHHLISGGAGKLRDGVKRKHDDVAFAAVEYHFLEVDLDEDSLRFRAVDDMGGTLHRGAIEKGAAAKRQAA